MHIVKYCKDCEPAQQSHSLSYISIFLNYLFSPFQNFFENNLNYLANIIIKKISVPLMNLLVLFNFAYFSKKIDSKISLRAKCLWDEAEKRGIKMKEFFFLSRRDVFIAEYDGKVIAFDGLPYPNKKIGSLNWLDDKSIMKKKFIKQNFPIAGGGSAFTLNKAYKIFDKIKKPIITKPTIGSRSRHTTIHINTKEELKKAFEKVKQISPFVIIEEELKGDLYRATFINKKFIACVKREAPYVIGNGINTIEELLKIENEKEERKGPIFHQIIIDKEAKEELKRQNVNLSYILENNRKIFFSTKTSRGVGGSTKDTTNLINKENIEILEKVVNYLNNDIIGIDFIIDDITKSFNEREYSGIIECNSLPFIDLHHYVMEGEPQNVAGKVWDLIFPESKTEI